MEAMHFVIELTPYPFDVLFSFNQSQKEFDKALREKGIKYFKDETFNNLTCMARTCHLDSGATIVRFKDFSKTAFGFGVLNHEIFHVVEFLFDKIGMPHNVFFTSEAYAYLIQSITERVYNRIGIK